MKAVTESRPVLYEAATTRMTDKMSEIAWLAAKPEYWPAPPDREALPGVGCLLFGVGREGVGWLDRLASSGWFSGLEPRGDDLAAAGGVARGGWAMPAGGVPGEEGHAITAAEAFFRSAPLPSAWYAAVAIPRGAGPEEWSATLGLVGALRERSDPLRRKLTVIATVDTAPDLVSAPFVRRLLDRGAFVVRADPDAPSASGDHLHHFPLRAAVIPRQGQLICVDLADYLHTWRPGRIAHLHVVPFAWDDAELVMCELPLPKVGGSARALNIGFQPDCCAQPKPLAEIDRFSTRCGELFLPPEGDTVFTNTDRLDGKMGLADLLVIFDGATIDA
jgi:hypothetical protein